MRTFDLVSDLHLDHYDDYSVGFVEEIRPGSDILVIAGDTFNGIANEYEKKRPLIQMLKDKYENVVMVLGNHDYYGSDFTKTLAAFERLEDDTGVVCLENAAQKVGDIEFAGTTLWFQNRHPEYAKMYRSMADFDEIGHFLDEINPRHKAAIEFLDYLAQDRVDVIITHHLPSYNSVHRRYIGARNNVFYVASVDYQIHNLKPKVWAHGHTHEPCDYKLLDTRVVCHPRGYPFEHSDGYQVKTIEVP